MGDGCSRLGRLVGNTCLFRRETSWPTAYCYYYLVGVLLGLVEKDRPPYFDFDLGGRRPAEAGRAGGGSFAKNASREIFSQYSRTAVRSGND